MDSASEIALAALTAYVGGSLPFAWWILKLTARKDVRAVADGNPGATNVFRAGGVAPGLAVLLLDVTKGVLPVVLARDALGLGGWALALAAVLPVVGAAFSPFLALRGGKALAVTLGTWIGLTTWTVPLVAVVTIVLATLLLEPEGWTVVVALAAMMIDVVLWVPNLWPSVALLAQSAVLLWKQRTSLAERPRWRRAVRPTP